MAFKQIKGPLHRQAVYGSTTADDVIPTTEETVGGRMFLEVQRPGIWGTSTLVIKGRMRGSDPTTGVRETLPYRRVNAITDLSGPISADGIYEFICDGLILEATYTHDGALIPTNLLTVTTCGPISS
jgi:hypothetical protein